MMQAFRKLLIQGPQQAVHVAATARHTTLFLVSLSPSGQPGNPEHTQPVFSAEYNLNMQTKEKEKEKEKLRNYGDTLLISLKS
eukprot:1145963-Pelagomonas_calceolata.AAC.2